MACSEMLVESKYRCRQQLHECYPAHGSDHKNAGEDGKGSRMQKDNKR